VNFGLENGGFPLFANRKRRKLEVESESPFRSNLTAICRAEVARSRVYGTCGSNVIAEPTKSPETIEVRLAYTSVSVYGAVVSAIPSRCNRSRAEKRPPFGSYGLGQSEGSRSGAGIDIDRFKTAPY
jgi:hypothetical protein